MLRVNDLFVEWANEDMQPRAIAVVTEDVDDSNQLADNELNELN